MNKALWKEGWHRALIGAPIGLAISTVIAILNSLGGDGQYYAVVPALIEDCGSELNAVIVQAICSLLYGGAFAGASVIWQTDWSLTKMTVVHLLVISLAVLPIAFLTRWMKHSIGGVLSYFAVFLAVYAIIWICGYTRMKKRVQELNQKVSTLR